MKSDFKWIILDTETDGLQMPIHALEISAQLMVGWQPVGNPFGVLINHDIDIDYQATAIHGYTREFLKKNGIKPLDAHSKLRDYVKDYPIVSHNLNYDWDRVLLGEWGRLGIPQIGRRGFCSCLLSKRVIPEVDSYKLDELKKHFGINTGTSHRATSDVATLVQLMSSIIAPRLSRVSIDTFEMIARFTKKDLNSCREVIMSINGAGIRNQPEVKTQVAKPIKESGPTVYHIARPGKVIGQYLISGLSNGLRDGSLSYDDYYWTIGMGQEWRKLSEIKTLIDETAPRMASERQVLYLKEWLKIQNAHLLTFEQANKIILKRGGYNADQAINHKWWSVEKLTLFPDLFKEELLERLSGRVLRDCLNYFNELYFAASCPLDEKIAMDVINELQSEDPKWWNSENFGELFFKKLKTKYPNCCDGKSVYYYKTLPTILSQYFNRKIRNASEQLTDTKVLEVINVLSKGDLNWYKKSNFKDLFFKSVQSIFPKCCDGQSSETRRKILKQSKEDEISEAQKEINSQLSLATNGDALAQYKLGVAKLIIGRLRNDARTINESFDWLKKSALSGNSDAQLKLAFFLSTHKYFNGFDAWEEVNAWLKFCSQSDTYSSGFQEVNGRKKYVINPIRQKILREIERIDNGIDDNRKLKSGKIFLDLCRHFGITPPV
jgi:DNA polymerase III epsilon subunit-like protein